MTLFDQAREAGRQAEQQFLAEAVEQVEAENVALRNLIAAVALQEGGAFFVSDAAMGQATELGFGLNTEPADGGFLVRALAPGAVSGRVRAAEPSAEAPILPEHTEAPTPPQDDEEDDVQVIDDDTPEARADRYLQAHQGGVSDRPPAQRAWDEPGDLAFQELPGKVPVRVIHRDDPDYDQHQIGDGQLRSGEGVNVSMGK